MSTNDFPIGTNNTLGQFWLPGGEPVTGLLAIDRSKVKLSVSPGLTPMHTYEPMDPGQWAMRSTEDPEDMVILGSIPVRPRWVTLWDAQTTRRRSVGWFNESDPNLHELTATWCILGDQITEPYARGVRPDLTNLTEWAWMPTLSQTIYPENRFRHDWHLDIGNKSLDAELADGAGYVTLGPAANIQHPGIRGLSVTTSSQLEFELLQSWTLSDISAHILLPLTDLLTILSGTSCVVRSVEIWTHRWCSMHGYRIDPNGPSSAGELLFTQPEVGLEFIPRWLALYNRTTPVPQMLAAAIRDEFPTVEAHALSLATAVEALHRILFPGTRRFTAEEIDKSLEALGNSDFPQKIADDLASALRQYWYESTYPQRVRMLAEPVATAVPQCIGRLGRWKNAVVEQRIALAHGKSHGQLDTDTILKMNALNLSLQWMLTFRLLLQTGVNPAILTAAANQSERFQKDSSLWNRHWPTIFDN